MTATIHSPNPLGFVGRPCHSPVTEKCPEPAPTDPGRPTPADTERGDASMAVSKRTRYEVLKRDNHTCRYCGGAAPDVVLTVDHVVPTALGGSDAPDNLVAACRDCNYGKASTSPSAELVADVAQDAVRWAGAIKQAADLMAAETTARWAANSEFNDLWSEAAVGFNNRPWWRPEDWAETLDTFRKHGLNQNEIEDSFWIMHGKAGMTSNVRWRYFCGICWRKITRLQEAAKAILESEA